MNSENPVIDAMNYFNKKEDELNKLPVCNCCGEPIQQIKAICYNDQWCCEECERDFWNDIRIDFLETIIEDEDDY